MEDHVTRRRRVGTQIPENTIGRALLPSSFILTTSSQPMPTNMFVKKKKKKKKSKLDGANKPLSVDIFLNGSVFWQRWYRVSSLCG
jgi:hypothetical protein